MTKSTTCFGDPSTLAGRDVDSMRSSIQASPLKRMISGDSKWLRGKGREGKRREGEGREGKGRGGKDR